MVDMIREYVKLWLDEERDYTIEKFGLELDDEHTREGHDWWEQQINSYFYRATVLGLDNPLGRQALAKCAATVLGCLESAVRVYGPLPEPGVPSGENTDRMRPLPETGTSQTDKPWYPSDRT